MRSIVVRAVCACASVLLLSNGTAFAQGVIVAEIGQESSSFGNAPSIDRQMFGIGGTLAIGEHWNTRSNFSSGLSVEYKTARPNDRWEFSMTFPDFAYRYGPITGGGGAAVVIQHRGFVNDAACTAQALRQEETSCSDLGQRELGRIPYAVGFTFFGKANVGPQGRAFAQVRYTQYVNNDLFSEQDNRSFPGLENPVDDFPAGDKLADWRISGGYVIPAGSASLIVRAQLTDRNFSFVREKANIGGLFNERSTQLTVGVGVGF
jgi:hypothetical protein